MQAFQYRNGELFAEDVALSVIAREYGTPAYVYSRQAIVSAYREFANATTKQRVKICYAMKANSNLGVLDCLAREGAGFDIVSGGELARVLAAGGKANQVVFSGVGKTRTEMRAALTAGVRCFNVESTSELRVLSEVASELRTVAPISLRVNPDVDAGTHPYISTGLRENKFGIAHEQTLAAYRTAASLPHLRIVGIDCHIGSQITELAPFLAAVDKVLDLVADLQTEGIELEHLDLGGGLGVSYEQTDKPPARAALIQAVCDRMTQRLGAAASRYELMFEFGRSIVAGAGVLLSQVTYLKPTDAKNFAIVDAAMNDLLRPSLYNAYHQVLPVKPDSTRQPERWDLVGPVCESGDWLARDCTLALQEADLLAFANAGAYGMAMSSNYNSRPRAVEVMVDGDKVHVVRQRETVEQLYSGEKLLP